MAISHIFIIVCPSAFFWLSCLDGAKAIIFNTKLPFYRRDAIHCIK